LDSGNIKYLPLPPPPLYILNPYKKDKQQPTHLQPYILSYKHTNSYNNSKTVLEHSLGLLNLINSLSSQIISLLSSLIKSASLVVRGTCPHIIAGGLEKYPPTPAMELNNSGSLGPAVK